MTQINPKDTSLIPHISEKIRRIIKHHSESFVFGPLAVGNHIDHLLVRDVCLKIFPTLIYWSDFPYNTKDVPDPTFVSTYQLHSALWVDNQEEKVEAVKGYQTQLKGLFPEGKIILPPDQYFLPHRRMHSF